MENPVEVVRNQKSGKKPLLSAALVKRSKMKYNGIRLIIGYSVFRDDTESRTVI